MYFTYSFDYIGKIVDKLIMLILTLKVAILSCYSLDWLCNKTLAYDLLFLFS